MQQQPDQDIGTQLEQLLREGRVKLEITGGSRTWRLLPSPRHQKLIDRIRASSGPAPGSASGCGCHHLSDVSLRFPDGSFKRPDIAIFCVEPPDIDESWEQVPEAVVEIVSPGYEEKDLSVNPLWHLAQGVKDVLVVDPRAPSCLHFSHGRAPAELSLPQTVELRCGCQLRVEG